MKYDPNRSLDEWAEIWSEVMTFTVPWLIEERHMMIVLPTFWGEHPLVMQTAEKLGLRMNFRLREALVRDGRRFDWIGYEGLHPGWVKRMGMPHGMEEGPEVREIRAPAPLAWPNHGEAPENAIIAGDRLYLRPLEPDDAALVSQWMLTGYGDFVPGRPLSAQPGDARAADSLRSPRRIRRAGYASPSCCAKPTS